MDSGGSVGYGDSTSLYLPIVLSFGIYPSHIFLRLSRIFPDFFASFLAQNEFPSPIWSVHRSG
jgi:hypothetical protein